AVAFEDDALVDEQGRGDDVAAHARRGVQLDRALGADVPGDVALDDHDADLNLGLHLGALASDQDVVVDDLADQLDVAADGGVEGELAFEFAAAAEEGVDLGGGFGGRGQLRHGEERSKCQSPRVYYTYVQSRARRHDFCGAAHGGAGGAAVCARG